jgi:hypothetical protein
MKIIWHFKTKDLTEAQEDNTQRVIKQFFNNSLVIFDNDLDIHILNDDEYHTREIELTNDFKDINKDEKGYRNIRKKLE